MSGYNHFKNLQAMTGYAQSKGIPMPREGVLLTGLMMFLGGLGILLGVYIGLSVTLLGIFLFVSALKMHRYWRETDPMMKMGERVNFMKNFALLGAVLMLLMIPLPWAVALF